MKKILILTMTLFTISVNMLADGLTATLQQDDNMQTFYGTDAFKQAYEAAESNDAIIILSIGTFNPIESIEKSMTIVGCGAFSSYSTQRTNINSQMQIQADNVTIEGIYFNSNVTLGTISNCHIKRCYLNSSLVANDTHTNTLIDQCVVKSDYAVGTGVNYTIQNTTLESFYTMNTENNKANITNCVIYKFIGFSSGGYVDSDVKQPYAIYISNILGHSRTGSNYNYNYTCSILSEYYYNYFAGNYGIFTPSFPDGCKHDGNESGQKYSGDYPASEFSSKTYGTGIDGTVKGTYGGSGFKSSSSIPKILTKTIPAYADEQGKINVSISATTGPN